MRWGQEGSDARIRLEPHYLGELTVSLKVEGGSVLALIAASVPEVQHWIETNETSLRQALGQQGLSLDRLIVVDEESGAASSDSGSSRHADTQEDSSQRRRGPRRRQDNTTFEVIA